MFRRFFSLIVALFVGINAAYAEEAHWMPDPALREAVRERLGIPADSPLTQAYLQEHLTVLQAINKGIVDLTGLEHATDLQVLGLPRNNISDLSPLSGLTGLVWLNLGTNRISDLSPLAGLVNLELLGLSDNQIRDVSPLAGLINLKNLSLVNNQISDISPLVGLINLENFEIQNNEKGVLSTLPLSKLLQFGYDETCDLEGLPIFERIENRDYPSIFGAFGGGRILNLPELTWREAWAYHDLTWSSLLFHLKWLPTPDGLRTYLHVESAKEERDDLLSLNPNMISIVAMNYQGANPGEYPDDWPYWLRDESGNIIGGEGAHPLIDFTYPEYQDYIVRQVIAFAKCGLFDGIFLDWWRHEWRDSSEAQYYAYDVSEAAITMLRRIREGVDSVRDDFLIIANTTHTKIPRSAPYVNGTFMETVWDLHPGYYTRERLTEIESTLLWSEENFKYPQINCLEGRGIPTEAPDSPTNLRWMRVFTTLSLTHSDGYVLYTTGIQHDHYWYPFWEVPLGRPVGGDETKAVLYRNTEGLFIREFTNGWAVYNRSGKEQTITLPMETTGVASGITATQHTVPDLDGEIYLKQETGTSVDVNGDGVVNIQDLVIVANALGEAEPDLNGDGVVNIQDLVIVANAFGNP